MSPEVVALDRSSTKTGALVYWRLEGELDPAELGVLWKRAGLDPTWLPETAAPATALSRAMRECSARRRMLRPLEGRAGHALVTETVTADELDYTVGLKVRLDVAGRPVFDPADHPLAPKIIRDYQRHLDVCSAQDIGDWLSWLVRRFDGVAMRDRGGIYYLPPARVAAWNAAVDCLRRVSTHRIFAIPAIATGEAVEAILDAIEQEATAEAAKMEEELASEGLKERALAARATRCEAVEEKVARYETLLGTKLDALRGRLEALRANLAAAALMVAEPA